jgi:hypothetical protein
LALGRFDDARLSYEAALAREPDRIDTLNDLGLALTGLGSRMRRSSVRQGAGDQS